LSSELPTQKFQRVRLTLRHRKDFTGIAKAVGLTEEHLIGRSTPEKLHRRSSSVGLHQ